MFPDPLRAFRQVVRAGSIRKAAEQLSVAPSSVSRQVAILERLIGTPLLSRSTCGLTLTYAGQLVAEYCENVISGFDSLRSDLNDTRGSSRLITVAMVESITSIGPTKALMAFRKRYPNVLFNFHVVPAPAVVEAVQTQKCDIGIGYNVHADQTIAHIAQIREPVTAVVSLDHPLHLRASVHVRDFADIAFAIPPRTYGVRQMFDRVCADHQVLTRPLLETNCFETLRDFARSGAGVSILPMRAAWHDQHEGRVRAIEFEHPTFSQSTLDIITLRRPNVPKLIQQFSLCLQENLTIQGDAA
ncbi:LysR family transcriptional regulator [Novosphingobium sp. 11B]